MEDDVGTHHNSLPLELSHAILDLVGKGDVVRMAGVSRQWRAAAIVHPLYYRQITVHYEVTASDPDHYKSERFSYYTDSIVQACTAGTPLKLRVFIPALGPESYWIFDEDFNKIIDIVLSRDRAVLETSFSELLAPALEQVLVGLDITLPGQYCVGIFPLLIRRAPRLAQLKVSCPCDGHFMGNYYASLPHGLFDGQAPMLQEVSFENIHLEERTFSALSAVHRVDITLSTGFYLSRSAAPIRLHVVFPSLRSFGIEIALDVETYGSYTRLESFDLSDCRMAKYRAVETTLSSRNKSTRPLPQLEVLRGVADVDMSVTSDIVLKDMPLTAPLLGPLILYVRSAQLPDSDLSLHVSIRSIGNRYIRTFRGSQTWDLCNVLAFLDNAADLRCDARLLHHCIGRRALSHLRVLHIIFPPLSSGAHLWTPSGVPLWDMLCPLLSEVHLHSRDALRVDSAQLVRLVRDVIPHGERKVSLCVCGPIEWRERDAPDRLDEVFDCVVQQPFDAFILLCSP